MGRGRTAAIACALGTLAAALTIAGCGAEEHANDPRPAVPTEVTASISEKKVNVEPAAIGVAGKNQQGLLQNEGETNPDLGSNTPLDVIFTVANLTAAQYGGLSSTYGGIAARSTGTTVIDNISSVPEPTSLGLLGVDAPESM